MDNESRFWAKVDRSGDCWVWKAALRNKGYGAFVYSRDGAVVQGRAHRYSWELHNGPIPEGLCVLHKCDNPPCVNPDHLWLGTKAENNADMKAKGRKVSGGTYSGDGYRRGQYPRGARWYQQHGMAPRAELFDLSAIQSDRAAGMTFKALAAKHGCSISHAHRLSKKEAGK